MIRWLTTLIPYIILGLLLIVRGTDPAPVERARSLVFDAYQRLEPRVYDPRLPVKIIDVDDESLARLGQWPWPRIILADLVERLVKAQAAAIAFDIVFSERDRSSPEQILEMWPATLEVLALRESVAILPPHDTVFAEAIGQAPVITGFVLKYGELERRPATRATFAVAGDDPKAFVSGFDAAVVNLEELETAATGNGAINSTPDLDQVVRRVPLVLSLDGALYPSLVAEALRVAQRARSNIIKSSNASGVEAFGRHTGMNSIKIGQFEVPTDPRGRLIVRFTKHVPDRYIPAWKVLQDDFDPRLVAGQIVFVGTSAPGLFDIRATPLEPTIPGVEIHAQAIEQIMSGDFLHRPDYADMAEVLYILVLGLLLIWLLPRVGAVWCVVLGGVSTAVIVGGSWYGFSQHGWLIDPIAPSLMVVFVFLSETVLSYLRSEAARQEVRTAFGRYLSPVVVERLAEHPERLELGGEVRTMTVMFADIRGFTTISERMKDDPQKLTRLINRFLTPMTEIVLRHGGTIDKYIGDCLMAFWNAPLDDPDHATHACSAAREMLDLLEPLNLELDAEFGLRGGGQDGAGLEDGVEAAPAPDLDAQLLDDETTKLMQAAEHGSAPVQYRLAKAYRDGIGVAPDKEKAAQWFERAASQGFAKAQRHLGTRYAQGEGVPKDDILAVMWLTLAAGQGLVTAQNSLDEALQTVGKEEQVEGERRARNWQPQLEQDKGISLRLGVGVSTGPCVVGNMGSTQRFDYSVLGDPVNLASRLEGQTKTYGVELVIGQRARRLAHDFAGLEIDLIAVKGRSEAERIYTLLGGRELLESKGFQDLAAQHDQMLSAYREQRWNDARKLLEDCTRLAPDLELLYDVYRDRIGVFEKNPPGRTWDGVYVATQK
jgi:adenylate cyclase